MKNYAVLLFLLSSLCMYGQLPRYNAQVFGPEQGIGGGGISDIFKDRQQFLWVMAANSLQRFDGRELRKYRFEKNLAQAICDAENRIWVLSGQKLWRLDTDFDRFVEIGLDTSGGSRPRAVFQLKGQPLCILTTTGISALRPETGRFETLLKNIPVPFSANYARFDTCGTVIFYPGPQALHAVNVLSGETRTLPVAHEIPYFQALTPDLVALSDYGSTTYWYDFARGKVTPIDARAYGLHATRRYLGIMGVEPLGGDRFLMTTRLGIMIYDLRTDTFRRERILAGGKPLEYEDALFRLFLEPDGTAWAHSVNQVVAFTAVQKSIGLLRNYHYEAPRQWNNRVVGFAEDDRQQLWFGGGDGFNCLDLTTGDIRSHKPLEGATDRLAHGSVRGIGWDGRYVVLGPTDKGVWLFDPRTERYRRPVYASDSARIAVERDFIDHLLVLRNKDIIVCGRFHVYRIKAPDYRLDFLDFPGERTNSNVAYEDAQGRLWVGTHAGLYGIDPSGQSFYQQKMPTVISIWQDDQNTFLIGTSEGLRRIRADQPQNPVEMIDSPAEGVGVTVVFRDSLGRAWLGTLDGLFLADPPLTVFRKFDFADNLQSPVFHGCSYLRLSSGMVVMGGINGLNYFFPEKIPLEDRPLSVSIARVRINDGDSVLYAPSQPFELGFRYNTLTVELAAPYFNNAAKVQYRYRLWGQSANWAPLGLSNNLRLNKLPPGDYRLEVEASLTGQTWYKAAHPLAFTVLPPFWQSWPFQIAILATLALLLWAWVRYRENRLKKRQQEELEMAALKNTALQYQLETEQVVNFFSRSISAKVTVDEALWDVAQQCISRLGFEDCVIYLLDETRRALVQKAAWGQKSTGNQQIVNPIEIPLGQGIVGAVAQSGEPELIADTRLDARYIVDDAARRSELAVPILEEGRVIGVIDTEHSRPNFYTPWHLQLLTAIAALCSNKIALARTEEDRRQALLVAVDNQRKAAEARLQSMRLQMNPHFLFNALNSIQQMTLSGNGDGAALYLSKFSKLLRLVLTYSDRDWVSLREELDVLRLYLDLESLRFDDTFEYAVVCEPGLDQDDYRVPTLLIQPFVENAIWHGLLHREGRRVLHVSFKTNPEEALVCTIEDNGIGREAARTFEPSTPHTGKGLSVSLERLKTLNQRHRQNNTLDIIDLYDTDSRPAGTRVQIVLH
ncbi:MAG: histidine kinase [Saprospiraceae bacterium]|nr:histidine kinase [Saprospiraceae bacterium]